MIKAIYSGTFDPMTFGHLDLIIRASSIFDHLIVGIGQNSEKKTLFTVEERVDMIREEVQRYKNIEVYGFQGLVVEFAKEKKAQVLLRGLRTEVDYVFEMQMALMNRTLSKKIETLFLPTRQDFSHISSTLVKEIAKLNGNISELVPKSVEYYLRKKFS
jgi:pantetheine-phosphate adenylyltransferase